MNPRTLPRTLLRGGIPAAVAAAMALGGAWAASAETLAYNGYDVAGDGWFETFGFDADRDGVEDTWTFDTDRDGAIDQQSSDTDDDGDADGTVPLDEAGSTDPFGVTLVLDVLHTDAAGWEWTPRFSYGFGYAYDAEAASHDEAGLPENAGGEPVPAATSSTVVEPTPYVMVMASPGA